jgi:polyphosphate glucokinase
VTDRQVAIGVDVGGSGIKAGAVDLATGRLITPRLRVVTPSPSTPDAIVQSIARLVKRAGTGLDATVPVGVGVPSVVLDGVTKTAANVDPAWIGFNAEQALNRALKRRAFVLNDADAAGLAEMRFGAGAGKDGVVLVLTLGTGVGSALFVDGHLVPNTELGHMEIRGRDAERRSAAVARTKRGLSWKAWTSDLDEHLQAIDRILWPSLIILGGGVSKRGDRFIPRLSARPLIVAATLQNDAGIVGAAMAAAERQEQAARAGR